MRRSRNHPGQIAKRGGPCLETDDRRTPRAVFAELDRQFGFTLDVAASAENAHTPRFFSLDEDGLSQSWRGERVWCNPPFSALGAWVEKAWLEMFDGCQLVVMLLPANRTEQPFWQNHIEPYRDCAPRRDGVRVSTRFLRHRFRFARPDGVTPPSTPPFGVCLVIWESLTRA